MDYNYVRSKLSATPERTALFVLGCTVLFGLMLRLWNISFGLPYLHHPDEPLYMMISLHIFKTGSLDPHFYHYPSLSFYINALSYIPYYLVGKLFGMFTTVKDIQSPFLIIMGCGNTLTPSVFILGRIISAVAGSTCIVFVFYITKKLFNSYVLGLLAAILMAASPTAVEFSHYATSDTLVVLFVLISFWASVCIFNEGTLASYIIAGSAAGLAASAKYNGGVIIVSVLTAHLMRTGLKGFSDKKLYVALISSAGAFFLTTPYALIHFKSFFNGLAFDAVHYATGHPGAEHNTFLWYILFLLKNEGPVIIISFPGLIYSLAMRSKKGMILSSFLLVYFIFISCFTMRNSQTVLPIIPFFFIFASAFIDTIHKFYRGTIQKLINTMTAVLISLLLIWPLVFSVKETSSLSKVDSRETARIWIEANLPHGSKIALEAYAPYVEKKHFKLYGINKIIEKPPAWYIANRFDYLIFSERMFKRFYEQPDLYREQIQRYNLFFSTFEAVKLFSDGGYEVRIYKIPDTGRLE